MWRTAIAAKGLEVGVELDLVDVVLVIVKAEGSLLVLSHMTVQRGLEGEPLSAELTRERLLLGVSLDVRVQVTLLGEPFLAEVTVVRLFAGVQPQVGDKVALLREALLADLTGEGSVGLEVLLGRALVLELDVTGGAIVGRRPPAVVRRRRRLLREDIRRVGVVVSQAAARGQAVDIEWSSSARVPRLVIG